MSRYKKERDDLNQRLVALSPETSILARQELQGGLDLLDTNELRRKAKGVGIDLDDAAGVGPWESHPDNPQIRWLPMQRQPGAIRAIESARSARRKERSDLLIKLAPILISLLALIFTALGFYLKVWDRGPSAAPTQQAAPATH